MKQRITMLICACFLVGMFSGCTGAVDNMDVTGTTAVDSSSEDTQNTDTGDTVATANPEPVESSEEEPDRAVTAGSIALFATLSGEIQSDFLRTDSGNVNWDTTHYKLLRFLPEQNVLDEFGWTSSKSYSKSFIYGITSGGWLYEVKCFTDSGRKDITRKDPGTGETIGSFGSITTSDMYGGFTIYMDKLIYRTIVSKDLMGNRTSGGNVMVMDFMGTGASEVLDYYDENNAGGYYGIGNDLITVVAAYEDNAWFYDIYRVDPASFAIGDLLYSFGSEEPVEFYSGETSLFWSEEIPGVDGVYIINFPLSGSPEYFLEITESVPFLLTVDESNGKVLITFKDNTPESPFYYLADMYSDGVEELDIDPAFFSTLKNGNGQFHIFE